MSWENWLIFFFASCMIFPQVSRYAAFSADKSSQSDVLPNDGKENAENSDFTSFIHQYISSHINDSQIKGIGTSETLLRLQFGDNGILLSATATGPNSSLNRAVQHIFKQRKGKRFSNIPILNAHRFHIPIALKH